jgi:hypothetical protein
MTDEQIGHTHYTSTAQYPFIPQSTHLLWTKYPQIGQLPSGLKS